MKRYKPTSTDNYISFMVTVISLIITYTMAYFARENGFFILVLSVFSTIGISFLLWSPYEYYMRDNSDIEEFLKNKRLMKEAGKKPDHK